MIDYYYTFDNEAQAIAALPDYYNSEEGAWITEGAGYALDPIGTITIASFSFGGWHLNFRALDDRPSPVEDFDAVPLFVTVGDDGLLFIGRSGPQNTPVWQFEDLYLGWNDTESEWQLHDGSFTGAYYYSNNEPNLADAVWYVGTGSAPAPEVTPAGITEWRRVFAGPVPGGSGGGGGTPPPSITIDWYYAFADEEEAKEQLDEFVADGEWITEGNGFCVDPIGELYTYDENGEPTGDGLFHVNVRVITSNCEYPNPAPLYEVEVTPNRRVFA